MADACIVCDSAFVTATFLRDVIGNTSVLLRCAASVEFTKCIN